MTIEAAYGVPTVALHTDKFDRVAGAVAAQNGMPGLRQAFVPQPVMGKTAAELRAYVDGRDPISRRPVMQEVIEGLTRPFTDDERGSSSSSLATMAVVNGPVRHEIAMNVGTGALGPHNHANATIGRAYGLLSQNLQGGSVPGLTYMGSMGNNYAYNSVTFGENEERSPWEPFHVQHGFRPTDSTVSVFTGCRSTAFTLGLRERYWREHVRNMFRGMDPHTPPTLLLDPITARQFVDRRSFLEEDALVDWSYDNPQMPAWG